MTAVVTVTVTGASGIRDAESGIKPLQKWCILIQMTVATTATTVADAIRDT